MSTYASTYMIVVGFICVSVLVVFLYCKGRSCMIYASPGVGVNVSIENHPIVIRSLRDSPKMFLIDNLVSSNECELLIQQAEEQGFSQSTVQSKTQIQSPVRTSHTVNLTKSTDLTRRLRKRVALLTHLPESHIEPFQVVRYSAGQEYKPHYDYFPPGKEGTDVALKQGGQRHVTLFVYLNDVKEQDDGCTEFPTLNMRVQPKKGMAAYWMNVTPDGKEDPRVLHAGRPPKQGTKYGLNIWIRERPFV